MAITLRSVKGSALTHNELDGNFTDLVAVDVLKAPLASPPLTGVPTAPTAAAGTNTTQVATTAHVFAERSNTATLTGKTMSGASNTFSALPAAGISGVIPGANIATGTPNGAKFLRDDQVWTAIPGGGDLLAANNLSDVANAGTARTNLGVGSVTNTSDANKPVSTAQQTALDLKANLASPTLTGTPAAPTASAGTSTTQLATTAFVAAGLYPTEVALTGSTAVTSAHHDVRVRSSATGTMTFAVRATSGATRSGVVAIFNASAAGVLTAAGVITAPPGYKLTAEAGEFLIAYYDFTADAYFSGTPIIVQSAINAQSAAYTYVATDAGKTIYHPPADTTARVFTMPANASVAYPLGTVIHVSNGLLAGTLTLAITSDVQTLKGAAGGTGSRTLAAGGKASYQKMTATGWEISGSPELT